MIYSDLDDTITSNKCLYYSKVKYLTRFSKLEKKEIFQKVVAFFEINTNFLSVIRNKNIKEVFILSRNNHDFIEYFINYFNNNYAKKYGFHISGGKGNITSQDKINIAGGDNILISDIFEYQQLKSYKKFISVNSNNKNLYKYTIILKKMFYFLKFILLSFFK